MSTITMQALLEAGVHFGHRARYWNPKMAQYIYGVRNDVHIINLEHTLPMFQETIKYVSALAANKGKILFVGTKRAAQEIIREEAARCSMPYIDHRWLGGMLTNYKTIRLRVKRLKDLEQMKERGEFDKMIKKEALQLERELFKLKRGLDGIKEMAGLPDALFVIDVGFEKIAITEANKLKIPVIGIVDTNNSLDGINYIVPGNDDSMRSIRLYASTIADAILEGKATTQHQPQDERADKASVKAQKEADPKIPDTIASE